MHYKLLFACLLLALTGLTEGANAANITRQDFIDSVIEESCEGCQNAHALTQWKYLPTRFVDITKDGPSRLCANMAEERGFIEGYDQNTPCQDGSNPSGIKLCPNNAITKVEAVAIALRAAYLWNEELDKKLTTPRTPPIGIDPKWAHYLSKAKEYNIWKGSSGEIPWNDPLTKEEGDTLIKTLSSIKPLCPTTKNTNAGGLGISIRASLSGGTLVGSGIIEGPFADRATIEWTLITRTTSGDTTTPLSDRGLTLTPITLQPDTEYGLILSVTSADGVKSTAFVNIPSAATPPLTPNISPLWDGTPLNLQATNNSPLTWSIADTPALDETRVTQTLMTPGVYPVSGRSDGLFFLSSVFVTPDSDLDKDGILNALDACPRLKGPSGSNGCPTLSVFGNRGISTQAQEREKLVINQGEVNADAVGGDRSGNIGSIGDIFGNSNGAIKNIYDDTSACERDAIASFGSIDIIAACSQCPCQQTFTSRLTIKACDRLYPAYLSGDKSTLYSQGSAGEVPFRFGF